MDEINLWKTGPGRELAPLESVAQLETELQLEDILAAHPELLDGEIELVGRQTPAAGGWLDLLAVDAEGRLVQARCADPPLSLPPGRGER